MGKSWFNHQFPEPWGASAGRCRSPFLKEDKKNYSTEDSKNTWNKEDRGPIRRSLAGEKIMHPAGKKAANVVANAISNQSYQALGRMPNVPGRHGIDINKSGRKKEDETEPVESQGCNNEPGRLADGEDDVPDRPGKNADDQDVANADAGDKIGQEKSKDKNLCHLGDSHDPWKKGARNTDFFRREERSRQDIVEHELGGNNKSNDDEEEEILFPHHPDRLQESPGLDPFAPGRRMGKAEALKTHDQRKNPSQNQHVRLCCPDIHFGSTNPPSS